MRTVAIIFGDNDFSITFRNLLKTIHRALVHRGLDPPSHDDVALMIRKAALSHYMMFQAKNVSAIKDYDLGATDNWFKGTRPIPGAPNDGPREPRLMIFFDEAAEAAIERGYGNDEAWYLEVQTGEVYAF